MTMGVNGESVLGFNQIVINVKQCMGIMHSQMRITFEIVILWEFWIFEKILKHKYWK
jgi:hypothetical protein